MGHFFRAGRLVSADTFRQSGTRTLAAATESDLWDGAAATRPWPAAEQLRIVSTSAEDDNVKTQSGTITIAGTMDPILTDEWDCVAAGAVDNGDIARLTLNGVHFDVIVSPAIANLAALVGAVADAAMLGSFDVWSVLPGGTLDAGDIITLTVPGAAASPYTYTVQALDTPALVSAGLKALVDADGGATYTAAVSGSYLFLDKVARGAGAAITCTWTTDPGLDATATVAHVITGVAAQTDWTVTDDGVDTVNCLETVPGVTVGTVACSYTVDPGVDSTFVAGHTVTGADPDVLEVSDGATSFSRTVATAVLADEVAALAALINADAAYVASAIGGVITVSAAVPGVGFTFTDNSTDLQTADLSVVIDNTANMANGGGTGLRTLRIAYLDGTGAEQVETVTMDGLTPVLTTATDVTAIQSVTGITFGSTGAAVGAVSIKDVAAAVIFGTVDATQTQEESATYRIPLRKKGWVVSLDLSAGAVATTVKLKSDCNPATGAVVSGATFTWGQAIVGTDPASVTPAAPWGPFPAAAKVWLTGTSAAGTACSGAINGYLEPAQ